MMSVQSPTLSVIMPAYNEEGAIESAVLEVKRDVLDLVPGSSLIVVNDGSKDKTGEIMDRLSRSDPRIRVIHKQNGGHGPAVRTGLDQAESDFVFLIDSDLQIPLGDFMRHWPRVKTMDALFGMRVNRHDPKVRLWLTRLVRLSIWFLFGVYLRDANVPYKVLRRSVWTDAARMIPPDTLAPSLFLAIFTKKKGYRLIEEPVDHKERGTGEVSIRKWKLIQFCYKGFRQMMGFRSALRSKA